MCLNNGWFSRFKELDEEVVFIGNYNAYKIMGISSIQLKNHDDSIQVLTNIRYVPSLKKNFISLGVPEYKGLPIIALTVMKGIKRNNLYYF